MEKITEMTEMTEYSRCRNYLDKIENYGSRLGLDTMKELMGRLSDPQNRLKIIHVAGTNGKGSTMAYIGQILKEAGIRFGKYTSPAVFDDLEKFQTDNINITEEEFAQTAKEVIDCAKEMVKDGFAHPTVFEMETAIAYSYFYRKKCEVVLIETGMGGDMDATNVEDRVLMSIITSISLDHTAYLGDTVAEIARHKGGIIKEGCPVIMADQTQEAVSVIENMAKSRKSPFIVSGKKIQNARYIAKTHGNEGFNLNSERQLVFDYTSLAGNQYKDITTSMTGAYQKDNCANAIEAVELLIKYGYRINRKHIYDGILKTVWNGRFQIIKDKPMVILDGAHNPGAVKRLKETIDGMEELKKQRYIFIMGVLADKDYSEEIDIICRDADMIFTVTPDNKRALDGENLKKAISEVNKNVFCLGNMEKTVKKAMEYNKPVIIFGSLSFLGTIRRFI